MNEDDFSRLPPAAQAYIRELESDATGNCGERITQLEEQFRLAQSKRFAPSSEKLKDRVFDEAEQIAGTEPDDDDAGARRRVRTARHGSAGCRRHRREANAGRKPLPAHLPRQRIEYDLPERRRRSVRAARTPCTAWAKRSANSCTSR